MKCPYTDIGCWHIDDVTHDCEATSRSECPHEPQNRSGYESEQDRKKENKK